MNSKGFSVNSYIIGLVLCFGLFFAVIGNSIGSLQTTYGVSGANSSELDSYNHLDSLNNRIADKDRVDSVTGVNVEDKWYDWFAGLWSKLKGSFVFVIKSYESLISVTEQSTNKFQLDPAFSQALTTIIILLVVFGLLLGRYFFGRK